ncbi:MAG: hypothetical protein WCC95_03080 [Candidatus Sulfotelmatobacter sp.]
MGSKSASISIKQACNPGYDSSHVHSVNQGVSVQGIALQSGWETFLLAAPLVGMILVGVFRLDKLATNPDPGRRPQRNTKCEQPEVHRSGANPSPWSNPRGPAVTTSSN